MKNLREEFSSFLKNKTYILLLALAAVMAYGFTISHETVGIDDTAIELYFRDGIAPAMGRWVIYLMCKIIPMDAFAPWTTELASVLIFMGSVTIWCMVIRRIVGDKIPMIGYALFAALFISCPLISEVYIYYLHNGICMAYGMTALALLCLLEGLGRERSNGRRAGLFAGAEGLLCMALGCYESMILVYVIGAIFALLLIRVCREEKYLRNVFLWGACTGVTAAASMVLRSAILKVLRAVFDCTIPDNYNIVARSLLENAGQPVAELFMALKKFAVMYYLNAVCYLPITILVVGLAILFGLCIYAACRNKDFLLLLFLPVMAILPPCMVLIEGYATHYRASQYVPMIFPMAVILWYALTGNMGAGEGKQEACEGKLTVIKVINNIVIAACLIVLFNQCTDMNRWFYVDYLKYENVKTVLSDVSYDLQKNYDTDKTIVFRGAYGVPYEIAKDAYLPFNSGRYRFMRSIADKVDEHLLEKFNAPDGMGYVFAETPVNSTLQWGITAFDNTAEQLNKFCKMHGYGSFRIETDLDLIEEAQKISEEMPEYPRAGYIRDCGEYIIVNL